ncbi:hypothetical protein [Aeromicrobium sp. UC242_57]|uniref:hypothetical protein n=1 Tax=Aeromicrobium sp. UC242_57 TaxID=3374624 RepID=UPI0037A61F75
MHADPRQLPLRLSSALNELPELFASKGASTLLFLPLAHVFARIIQVGAIRGGSKLGHTADVKDLVTHLGTFQPTFVLGVPRVFEKVFNTASGKAYADGKGKIFDRAAQTAMAYSRALDTGKPGLALRARHALFDKPSTASCATHWAATPSTRSPEARRWVNVWRTSTVASA